MTDVADGYSGGRCVDVLHMPTKTLSCGVEFAAYRALGATYTARHYHHPPVPSSSLSTRPALSQLIVLVKFILSASRKDLRVVRVSDWAHILRGMIYAVAGIFLIFSFFLSSSLSLILFFPFFFFFNK